jgi:dethiobiotin synthetase
VSFFITGTDTGVGKTHTAVQLLRLLRANGRSCAGFKPICCGDRRDAELLLSASANGLTIDEINPLWLKTPAVPLTAAQIEAVNTNIEPLLDAFRKLAARVDDVFVEGVGGWCRCGRITLSKIWPLRLASRCWLWLATAWVA